MATRTKAIGLLSAATHGSRAGNTRSFLHGPQLAATLRAQVKFLQETAMPAGPVLCVQCDKPEYQCTCDRYCTICKSMEGVRLCMDGLYYCPDCREACDVTLADTRGH